MSRDTAYEKAYNSLLTHVIDEGKWRPSRVGKTRSIFGATLTAKYLADGLFPLLTARKMHPRGIMGELATFLQGKTKLSDFKKNGCNYWDSNAKVWVNQNSSLGALFDDGTIDDVDLGPIYGAQWRNWNNDCIDQIKDLVDGIQKDPFGRRHVVSAWNPSQVDAMCLPPCHIMFQCYVANDDKLHMMVYMRSVDLVLGLPTDVALYAGLLVLLAQTVRLWPGTLIFTLGDAHIYEQHMDGVLAQLDRHVGKRPTYTLDPKATVFNFEPHMLTITDYHPQEKIDYALNV